MSSYDMFIEFEKEYCLKKGINPEEIISPEDSPQKQYTVLKLKRFWGFDAPPLGNDTKWDDIWDLFIGIDEMLYEEYARFDEDEYILFKGFYKIVTPNTVIRIGEGIQWGVVSWSDINLFRSMSDDDIIADIDRRIRKTWQKEIDEIISEIKPAY